MAYGSEQDLADKALAEEFGIYISEVAAKIVTPIEDSAQKAQSSIDDSALRAQSSISALAPGRAFSCDEVGQHEGHEADRHEERRKQQ